MKSLLALFVFALVCGCSARPSNFYKVSIDSAFTPEQTNLVLESLRNWEKALDGRLTLTYGIADECSRNDKEDLICIHSSTRSFVQSISDNGGCIGFTLHDQNDSQPFGKNRKSNSSDVYIPVDDQYTDGSNPGQMVQVVEHEVGHAMSLVHSGKGDVMYYSAQGASQVITCDDVHQWENLRGEFQTDCKQ